MYQSAVGPSGSGTNSLTQTQRSNTTHTTPYRPQNQTQQLSDTRVLISNGASTNFHLPLSTLTVPSSAKPSAHLGPTISAKPSNEPSKRGASASKRSAPGTAHGVGWKPFGTEKIKEKQLNIAAKHHATSSAIAKVLGQVRGLEKDVKPTVPYSTAARPSSASIVLPPLGASAGVESSPTSKSSVSSLFNRTAPLASGNAVLSPVAGVDDPIMHTYTNMSVTGQSALFTSQRLHDLAVSKQTRHFDALNEYKSWRSRFDRELNDEIDRIASSLRTDLDTLEKPLRELLFERMVDEEKLLKMDIQEIQACEKEFHENYTRKQRLIDGGIHALQEVENTRAAECTQQLSKLVDTWLRIAHLPAAECERELAQESKELNIHLLKNLQTQQELGCILSAELVLKQKETWMNQWIERFTRWKQLRHGWFIEQFRVKFLEDYPEPSNIDPRTGHPREEPLGEREYPFQYSREKREVYDGLITVQRSFTQWTRTQVVEKMLKLTPSHDPVDLKSKLELLAEESQSMYTEYDQSMDGLISRVREVEQSLREKAHSMVATLVGNLRQTNCKPEDEIRSDIEQLILPLLQEREAREDNLLQKVERSLRHFDSLFLRSLDQFSHFSIQAGERWDAFLLALQERNTFFEEALNERRDSLEDEEARLEERLKEELEALACEPSIASLDERLTVVRNLVGPDGLIEQAYRKFYEDSLALSIQHPLSLQDTTQLHSSKMAQLFGLNHPADAERLAKEQEEARLHALHEQQRLEEEEDAKLSKRDKAKKDKLKAQQLKEEQLAQEAEAKARLAKAKQQQADAAKAEKEKAKAAAAATASTEDPAAVDESADASIGGEHQRSKSRLSMSGSSTASKLPKKSEEELLAELKQQEESAAALEAMEKSITQDVFFSLDAYKIKAIEDAGLVKEIKEVPLSELGLVEIQSGELEPPVKEIVEETDAKTVLTPEQIRALVKYPDPPAAPVESEKRKKSSSKRSSSPFKTAPATAAVTVPAPSGVTVPTLILPQSIVRFTRFLTEAELLDKILTGGRQADHASDFITSPSSSSPAAGSGGEGAAAATLSLGAQIETAAEREARLKAESDRQAAEAAASALAAAQAARPSSAERAATGTPGAKRKKKTAKELAKEEELARAQAEEIERQKQAESDRLEALKKEAEQVPVDQKGLEILSPIQFPSNDLSKRLSKLREEFLVTLEYEGRSWLDLCQSRNNSIAMDLVKELNLKLRQYKPRLNRIEVDVYEVRAKALNTNLKSYERFITRLTQAYEKGCSEWEGLLLRGEKEYFLFAKRVSESIQALNELTKDPYGSLSELNGINTRLKQQKLSFQKSMSQGVFESFQHSTRTFAQQVEGQIRSFVSSCQAKQFGASGGYQGAQIEELDENGNPIVLTAAERESYHPDEVSHYSELLQQMHDGFNRLLEEQSTKLESLRKKYDDILTLQSFQSAYGINLQNLSINQGLGHHNGAPKRNLTVALRSEYNKSLRQQQFIDSLLDELERANKGELKVSGLGGKGGGAGVTYATSEEEKSASTPANEDVGATDDLAKAFQGLSLSTPSIDQASTLSAHLLKTLDALRTALYARAQYLGALKPGLPKFELKPVTITPEEESSAAAAKKQAELAAKAAAETEASSSRRSGSKARVGSAERQRPGSSSSPSASPATKPLKRGTKVPDESLSAPPVDPNASSAPSFISLVEGHVLSCRTAMASLLGAYQSAYPDRKPAKLPDRPGTAEEKEEATDGKKLSASAKKKQAAAAKEKEKRAARGSKGGESSDASAAANQADQLHVPPAIEEHCSAELARSQAHLEASTTHLLSQADRAAIVLAGVGQTILGDVFSRLVSHELQAQLDENESTFSGRSLSSFRAAARNREKLRPVLGSRPDKSLLDLRQREDERYVKSLEDIKAHRRRQLQTLQDNSSRFVNHLLHSVTSLLTLLDSMVLPVDLSNVLKDGDVLKARKSLKHLVKESKRLHAQKVAIAEQAGVHLDELGNVLAPAVGAPSAPTGKPRVGSAKKKSASQLAAEQAEKDAALAAGQQLLRQLDARYIKLTWPGIRVDSLVQPEDEETKRAREQKEQQHREAAAAAALAAEGDGKRKRKSKQASTSSVDTEAGPSSDRGSGATTPTSPPTAKPVPAPTAAGGRRSKKQRAEDEAAAAAAAAAAALAAQQALVQTPAVTGLNQPTQRAVITSRDGIYNQYVALYQQQVQAIIDTCDAKLAAEAKARQEWEEQVNKLTNPEPLQFE